MKSISVSRSSFVILLCLLIPCCITTSLPGMKQTISDAQTTGWGGPESTDLTAGDDWLSGWRYRVEHLIHNSTGAGSNYQIQLTVLYGAGTNAGATLYCDTDCQSDFDDLRFTDDDGVTLLDYWRESFNDSENATFWIEVADSLDYNVTIFVYYGNTECDTTSDGDSTFLFFDDFEDSTLDTDKWDVFGPWIESAGYSSVSITSTGSSINFPSMKTDGQWDMRDVSIVSRWRINQLTVNREWGVSCADTAGDDHTRMAYFLAFNTSGLNNVRSYYDVNSAPGYDHFEPVIGQYVPNEFMITEIVSTPNNVTKNSWIQNQTILDTYSGYSFDSTPQFIFLGCYVYSWNGILDSGDLNLDFDYVFLRSASSSKPVQGEWQEQESWLSGWSYRKSHELTNSTGAGSNYQVSFNVVFGTGTDSGDTMFCEEKCQPDFDDIRFTDNDGATLLDYWRESYLDSENASFWVKIADSLDNDVSIFIYYGNSSCSSTSNGTNTFIFFDDYENNNLDRWDGTTSAGFICATDEVVHGTYSLKKYSTVPGADIFKNLTQSGEALTHDFMVHSWIRDDNQLRGGHAPLVRSLSENWVYACRGYDGQFSYLQDGLNYVHWPDNYTGGSDQWFEINVGLSMSTDKIQAWKDGLYMGEISLISGGGASISDDLYAIGYGQQSNYVSWWDDTFVRKWAVSEPTHGVWDEQGSATWHHDCSNTTGFSYNDSWNINWMQWNSVSGNLSSDGSELSVSYVPIGTLYHGPVFEYALPEAFAVEDLLNFSVQVSADNSLASYLGYQVVMLGDANRNPVMFLSFGDGWSGSSQGAYGVSYVYANGSRDGYGSGYPITWTAFDGSMGLRYNESLGLMGNVEGIGDAFITAFSESDRTRQIHYVAIASARHDTSPLFPMLVDEIFIETTDGLAQLPRATIVGTDDFALEAGTGSHEISWQVENMNPTSYEIYRNSSLLEAGLMTGSTLTYHIANLYPGVYDYMAVIYGDGDVTVVDHVIVTASDTTAPFLSNPMPIWYELGSSGNVIYWTISDLDPGNYKIYQDGEVIRSIYWTTDNVYISIDGLDLGRYNFTIQVFDASNNHDSDTVIVTVEDTTAPTVNSPTDITLESAAANIDISWLAEDLRPDTYKIYRDDILVANGSWSEGNIIYQIPSNLLAGVYNYTIVVYDTSGNFASDTIIVEIQQTWIEGLGDITVMAITIGGFSVIVIVVVLILKNKQEIGVSGFEYG